MPKELFRKAVIVYETAKDPLLLDAIRALSDPDTPLAIRKTAEDYVRTSWNQYLTLMRNSGTSLPYGYDPDPTADGDPAVRTDID